MAELNEDEVDDLLYFARHNEIHDLKECAMELSKKYGVSQSTIFQSTLDPHSGNTVLHLASANGHLEAINAIIESTIGEGQPTDGDLAKFVNRQNQSGNTALHWAALNGHADVVLLLIQRGADPSILNAAGHDALFEAELNEKTKAAEVLLTEGKELESGLNASETEAAELDDCEDIGSGAG